MLFLLTLNNKFLTNNFVIFVTWLISCVLLYFYTDGDQVYYYQFYSVIGELSYTEAFTRAPTYIGSNEPVTIFILWFGSFIGIDKFIYISFWNFFLIYLTVKFISSSGASFLSLILIVCSYYFIVIYTGAERLKFGFIFLFLSLYFTNNKFIFLFFTLVSILSHYQMSIFYSVMIIFWLSNLKFNILLNFLKNPIIFFFFISVIFLVYDFFYLISDVLIYKYAAYGERDYDIYGIINFILFCVLIFTVTRFNFNYFFVFIPYFFYVMLFGSQRVTILLFLSVIVLFTYDKKINNNIYKILLVYFFVKGVFFMYNIFVFNTGFV